MSHHWTAEEDRAFRAAVDGDVGLVGDDRHADHAGHVRHVGHADHADHADHAATLRQLDVARMVADPPPPVPWVVDRLAVRGCLTLLTGREGEGKSLLAASLAAGVASAHDVAGIGCRRGSALIVDAENGAHEIHRRVHSLGLPAQGVKVFEAEGFHLGRNLPELAEKIRKNRPTFLVLDSFRSLWPGGDENDSAAVGAVLDTLLRLVRAENVAGLLLHHLPKSGGDYRGSTAFGGVIELGFRLGRVPNDPEREHRRKLECWKCRPAPQPKPLWLQLRVERERVFVDAAQPVESEPKQPAQPARAQLTPTMLAAAIEPILWTDLACAIGRTSRDGTARRLRDDLAANGELRKLPDGRWLADGGQHARQVPDAISPKGTGTMAPLGSRTNVRPGWLDSPELLEHERSILDGFDALVEAGEAEWVEDRGHPCSEGDNHAPSHAA